MAYVGSALYRAPAADSSMVVVLNRPSPATGLVAPRAAVGVFLPLLAAALAMALTALAPLLSAMLVAIALGVLAANTLGRSQRAGGAMHGAERAARHMLRIGIVLLGLQVSGSDLAAIGWRGLLVVALTVGVTFVVTVRVGRRLRVDAGLATLIAAGFSICGAAAIASVSSAVRAKSRDVGLAVALVTIFGTAMIAVVPWLAHLLGLDERDAAMWAGASIHEVAQVVAAGSILGGTALATATTVKLARVVMIAPITAIVKRRHAGSGGAAVPWFVVGFVVAVGVRNVLPLPAAVLEVAGVLATLLLAAGMFGMGLSIRVRDLWPLPGRAFVLAAVATAIATLVPLGLLAVT